MSSAPLRVFLTTKEDGKLWSMAKNPNLKPRTRLRIEIIRLSHGGWKTEKIASYQKCSTATVRRTLHRWKLEKFEGLEDKARPGRKQKWQEEDLQEVENKLTDEPRSYSSRQLREFLKETKNIELSERQLRRILKKKIFVEKNTTLDKREK
jgi:transposase